MFELIQQKRLAKGLTYEEVGDLCDMSDIAIQKICKGQVKDIKLQTAFRLSEVLDFDIEELRIAPKDESKADLKATLNQIKRQAVGLSFSERVELIKSMLDTLGDDANVSEENKK